ncbi:TIGR01777 family oxidoreductase [bacterium AH-315-J21]|nr:TIGR01777 family oxidoreductase [bacterium AH-315-J21]
MSKETTPQFTLDIDSQAPLTVAVTGASGFVGSALMTSLREMGINALQLVREKSRVGAGNVSDNVFWDPLDSNCDFSGLDGIEAVVHLAGESIIGLWTVAKRQRIYESRVTATKNLAIGLAALKVPPKTLICASAVGFYGDCGDVLLSEDNQNGQGFLASTCLDWEAAAEPAREAGIRVVNLRIGIVLDPTGGALQKAIGSFRLGLGGRFGSGKQYMSWVTREDLVRMILFALEKDNLTGAMNAVAPNPLTNAEYTKKLSAALNRPAFMTVPSFLLRLAPGGMADEMFLASVRAVPSKALAAGFEFRHPDIDTAFEEFIL